MLTVLLLCFTLMIIPVLILSACLSTSRNSFDCVAGGFVWGVWLTLAAVLLSPAVLGPSTPDYEKNVGKDLSAVFGFKRHNGDTYLQFDYHGRTYKLAVPLEDK